MNDINGLIEKFSGRAYAAAYRLTGDQSEASDLVQEAFVRVLERAELYDPSFDFNGWLYRIIFRTFLNRRRTTGRRREVSLEAGTDEEGTSIAETAPAGQEESPAAIAERKEVCGKVAVALSELSDDYRACLVLVDVEGRNYDEAADILGWPVGSVSGRVFRARRLLRKALETRGVRG